MNFYPPAAQFAGHPYYPERLGYVRLLELVGPDVARLLKVVKPYTLMTARNLTTLYRETQRTLRAGVQGSFVEVGVHRGGSAGILAELIKDDPTRHLHLFDRWGDFAEPTERDGFRQEQYRRERMTEKLAALKEDPPLDRAKHLLEEVIGFPTERLHYYPGWISDTLKTYDGGPIAFASLDCDFYESMKEAIEVVGRFAAPNATIVADDYGTWPGSKAAIDEWVAKTSRKVEMHPLRIGPAVLRFHG